MRFKIRFFLFLFYLCLGWISGQVLSLNGVALIASGGAPSNCTAGGYKTINSASIAGNCVTFTSGSFQNGAIWACTPIDLNQSFKLTFSANFGSNTATGDGMAFLLQTEGVPQVIGGRAGGIGYAQGDGSNCQSAPCPISPSVAVEFDTWDNSANGVNDISCNHVSIQKNGIMDAANALVSPSCLKSGGVSVVDGLNHDVCITWDAAINKYTVFFDGVQVANYNGNIRTNFTNPSSVYWGFTGASGGFAQTQSICSATLLTNISSPSCSCTAPVASATPNPLSICSGLSPNVALSSSIAGTTFSWLTTANANVSGESSTSQSSATISDVLTNTTTSPVTLNYSVTPSAGGCLGSAIIVTVTVNPTPLMTSSTSTVICSGSGINLNLTSNVGSTYTWLTSNNASTTGESTTTQTGSIITNTIVSTATTSTTLIYTVTPTSSPEGCPGTPQTVTVTVNPIPVMTSTTSASVCSGVPLNISLTSNVSSTYSWIANNNANTTGESTTATSGNTINNTITNTTTTSQTVVYTVTPTSSPGGCVGATQTVTVTINPVPVMTSTTAATICSGGSVSIALTSNIASSYTWIATDNTSTTGESTTTQTTSTISNTITNTSSTAQSVVYTVTPTATTGSCPGTAQTVTVTVNPIPTMTSANTATVCSGVALNLSLSSNIASTYSWIAASNANVGGESTTAQAGGTINNTLTNTTGSVQTVVYTVTPTSSAGNCPGTPQTVTVTVNPLPVMTSTTSASVCSGVALNIGLTSNVSSSYTWIGNDNTSTTGESTTTQTTSTINNTITNTTTVSQTIIYTVTPTSNPGGCAGTAQTVTVTVNPAPVMTSTATATICSGNAINISLTSNVASSYSWIATDNTNTTGESTTTQTTSTINNTLTNSSSTTQTVVYTVTPTSTTGSCPGTPQTVTVTVNPTPVMTSTTSASICSGNAVNISLTSNVGSTYSWIAASNANVGGESTTAQSTGTINNTLTNTTATSQTVVYTVTPTSSVGNCPGTPQTVTVTVNNLPNANAGSNQTLTCASPTVTLSGSSTSTPVSYSWTGPGVTSGANSQTATANASGTYTLTVTNTLTGCSNTSTVSVSASAGVPTITMASSPTITCTNTLVTISGSSTTGGVTYQWSSGVTTPTTATTTVTAPGSYTLTVTDPGNGCTNSGVVVVGSSTGLPTVNAGSNQTITCTSPSVTLSGSSTTGGATYQWSPGGTTPTSSSTSVSASGVYTLTVTNPFNGCTNTATVSVTTNTTAPNISTSPSQTLTCSVSNVTLSGSSTTSGVSYQWSPGGTTPTSTTTNVSSSGTYTLTVTDPVNGCSAQSSISVSTNTATPNVSAGSNQTITCITTTVTLSGSSTTSGVSYQWSPGGTTPTSASTNVTSTGTYTLTVTDPANGCINTSTVSVGVNNTLPDLSMGSGQTITCTSTVVTVSGSSTTSGVTYQWSSGVTTPTSATTTVNAAGTYTLTVTNPVNGCSTQGSVLVSSNSTLPNVSVGANQTLTCVTTTASINGSSTTGGATYQWSPGGTTPNASSTVVNAAGVYTLTVSDPLTGCTNTATVSVSSNTSLPNVSITNTPTVSCATPTVTLTGSSTTSGVNYQWSPGGTTPTSGSTNVSSGGSYTLTVTNPVNGCSAQATVIVVTNTATPNVSAGSDQLLTCSQTSATLTGSSTTTGASFSWEGPNAGTPAGTTPAGASTSVNSTGTYTLTVTDPSNGCTASDIVIVNPDANLPSVSSGNNQIISCTNTTATISGSSTTPGVTYQWSGTSGAGTTPTSFTTTVNYAGTFTLTVTNPVNGCSANTTVNVTLDTVSPSITIAPASVINCSNTQIILTSSTNASPAILSWTGPSIVSGANSTTPVVSAAGTYTLSVTNNVNGCSSSATVLVSSDFTAPDANAGVDQNLTCGVSSLNLIGSSTTPGALFNWTGPGVVSGATNDTVVVDVVGAYVLTTTDPNNGCSSTDTVNVVPDVNLPDVNAGSNQFLSCLANSVTLSGSSTNPNAVYDWSGPGGFSATGQNVTVSSPGTYTLTVTDGLNNCSNADAVQVNDSTQAPGANAGNDVTLSCSVTTATLSVSSGITNAVYTWSGPSGFSSSTQSVTTTAAGVYTVTVTNPNTGCTSTDSVSVFTGSGLPNVSATATQTITCSNPSVVITASSTTSGVNFSWTGPGGFSSTGANASVINAGTYTVSVTDPLTGCTATASVTVSANTALPDVYSAAVTTTVTCLVPVVNLSGGSTTPGATLSWSGPTGPLSGNPASVSAGGTYTVTATNPLNGCQSTSLINVTVDTVAPVLTLSTNGDTLNCLNPVTAIAASSSTSGLSYNWTGPNGFTSTQSTSGSITDAGMYSVIATNPVNGCSSTTTQPIYQGADPVVSFFANPTTGAVPLPVGFTNTSDPGFSGYQWSFGDGNTSTTVNSSNTYYIEGTYTVQLVGLTPNNTCNDTADVIVIVYPPSELVIPNVFSPNGDGINEFFVVDSKGLKDIYIEIFDRWGLKLHTIDGPKGYWDGVGAPEGTYYYLLRAEGYDGKVFEKQGYLLLVR